MFFKKTDLGAKLAQLRDKEPEGSLVLQKFQEIINNHHPNIKNPVKCGIQSYSSDEDKNMDLTNCFKPEFIEAARCFHLSTIRELCISYRLRFLSCTKYKGDYPVEVTKEVKRLEALHRTELSDMMLMAPADLFILKNADDPLLFVPLGNNYFYLVYQWGNHLHPLRKWLMWPLKNMSNFLLSLLVTCLFLTQLIPKALFSHNQGVTEFWLLFFFIFKSVTAVCLFYGVSRGKNFSNAVWRSSYINS